MGHRSSLLDGFGDDFAWSLFDAAPDGIVVVADSGEIAFASDLAGGLFGCSAAELVGMSVDDLLPEALRGRHRAHRTRYRAKPEIRRMGDGLQLRARRLDGTEFDAEISLSPLALDGSPFVVAAVRDIGDRVAAEDRLHRVLHTLDASNDAIFIFDADTLQYSFVNEGAARLVGYDQAELQTMTPLHLNPYSTEAEYRTLVEGLLADPTATAQRETRLLHRAGTEIPVEKTYRAGPTARDGTRWVVALARDITDRLNAADEQREREELLNQAQRAVALADDRDRIARDLHDTVIQRLFAAGLSLQSVAAIADERVRTRIETTVNDLDETIRELRTAIFALQAPQVGVQGLRSRLLDLTAEASTSLGFEPQLTFDGPVDSVSERISEELLPTLREALSNVAQHAQASAVSVTVSVGDGVSLAVADDGVGPARGAPADGGPDELRGNGLANMARRAEKLRGTARLIPGPDGGSRLEWTVPLTSPVG